MCLVLIAIDVVPRMPLLLLGNRDEFHGRASAPAQPWSEDARVVGGRDLVANGSWLAARSDGRFATVTNVRSGVPATAPKSRGALVRDFVLGDAAPAAYLRDVHDDIDEFGAFNLVVGDRDEVRLLSSTGGDVTKLGAGIHVVSNGAPGVHWPKTQRLLARFEASLSDRALDASTLLDLLHDETQPADADLPDTGVGLDLERILAPVFIRGERYGTRASSLLMRYDDGSVLLRERRFGPHGALSGEDAWRAERGVAFSAAG